MTVLRLEMPEAMEPRGRCSGNLPQPPDLLECAGYRIIRIKELKKPSAARLIGLVHPESWVPGPHATNYSINPTASAASAANEYYEIAVKPHDWQHDQAA